MILDLLCSLFCFIITTNNFFKLTTAFSHINILSFVAYCLNTVIAAANIVAYDAWFGAAQIILLYINKLSNKTFLFFFHSIHIVIMHDFIH